MHEDKTFWVRGASLILTLLVTAACGTVPASVTPAETGAPRHVLVSEAYGKLPLYFEANKGQTDEQVRFLARSSRSTLFLTPSEAVLVFTDREQSTKGRLQGARSAPEAGELVTRTVLRMTFIGANPEPEVVGAEELPGKANYFMGSDPANWRTDVPTYAKVRYKNVYPRIDLIYYGTQRQLEYDFVVSPGADPERISLGFQGADKLEVDAQGDLVLHTATGVIRQRKPVIYQEVEGVRQEIAGGYVLEGARRVGFRVAAYNARRPLVIDPALFYSTYLGGENSEEGLAIAVDTAGSAYVTGFVNSTDFPTTQGAFQTNEVGVSDAFVTKLNPTGSGLVYSTYLGSGYDSGRAIAVDSAGNAYVTGETSSNNFPTTPGAFQSTLSPGAGGNAFVTKLNPTGSALIYSTYLGGDGEERGQGIAVDAAGNAYVTGLTHSSNFPTTPGAFQPSPCGAPREPHAFVTKLNPIGSALVYSTCLGGSAPDEARGIALDAAGNAYVTGNTSSSDFPTSPGAYQTTFGGGFGSGLGDAFVAKLDPTGSALIYSTYLGGSGDDVAYGIALDSSGNAYVVGATASTDFPTTPGAFQTTFGGGDADIFVTKVNPLGSALVYSTYLGGSGQDEGYGIAVDGLPSPNAYLTGETLSTDFPTTSGAIQTTLGGGPSDYDAFVTKLDPTGSTLIYSTYLGGADIDYGNAIAVDMAGNAYVTGPTHSSNFPTTPGAIQTGFGGGPPGSSQDAFVAQITEATLLPGRFSARVTGGGTINVVGGIGNFHFIIQRDADTGALSGRLQYVNHATGAQVQSVIYTSLVIAGNTATFDGTCTLNGAPCTFRVETMDNGEPGTTDTFTISYPFPAPTDGGTLRSGNILIR